MGNGPGQKIDCIINVSNEAKICIRNLSHDLILERVKVSANIPMGFNIGVCGI